MSSEFDATGAAGKPAHTFEYAPADHLAMYRPPTNGLAVSTTGYSYQHGRPSDGDPPPE